jgi:hypothetical protein
MTGSGRSLLRQASILFAVFCGCGALASPVLAAGPAPEPAPPRTKVPVPEPVPGAAPHPARSTSDRVSPPPSPPPAPPPAAPAPAPQPVFVSPPPPPPPVRIYVTQPPPAPPAAVRRETRAQRRETAKAKPHAKAKASRPRVTNRVASRPLPSLTREEATSPDTMLLAGGLALFVLVLADTVFLALSTRLLRGAR